MSSPASSRPSPPWSRPSAAEWALLAAVVALAAAARAWRPEALGIDHFDEGVYAFSALGISDPAQPYTLFPGQDRFAPPLFYVLAALARWATGASPALATVGLNVALGTLTVAAVWLVGRRWFGPAGGIAAAVLVAGSQFHVTMSRSGLTDVAFALLFLLAAAAVAEAVERGSWRWALLAGVLTGLAWNTKYHGWFVLLVGGLATVPFGGLRRQGIRPGRAWALGLGMAAVAALLYLPWALYLRGGAGGYGGIFDYYLDYLAGAAREWVEHLLRHVRAQAYLEGPIGRASVPLALAAALAATPRAARRGDGAVAAAVLAATVLTLALGNAGTGALAAAAAVLLLVLFHRPVPYRARVLVAWLGLWVVAAPVYHPYPRLILPFTVAAALAAGWLFARAAEAPAEARAGEAVRRWHAPLAAGAGAAVLGLSLLLPRGGDPWRVTDGHTPRVAARIGEVVPRGSRTLVIGEPTLAVYLHQAGRPAFERMEDMTVLDTLSGPVYVVTGVYTRRAPPLREGIERNAARLERLGVFRMEPSDLRILDDLSPAEARRYRARPDGTFDLTVYRLGGGADGAPAGASD